jgi:3-carboxy-cis,cis-muconate cycloisomerase
MQEPEVARRLDREAVAAMTDPAAYLGAAGVFVDRVLAAV